MEEEEESQEWRRMEWEEERRWEESRGVVVKAFKELDEIILRGGGGEGVQNFG